MWHIGRAAETYPEGCRFVPRHDLYRNTIFVSCGIRLTTQIVSFISLTVMVNMLLETEINKCCPSGYVFGAISNLITWVP